MVDYKSKRVFWQALVFTILIFGAGMMLGYFLEVSREKSVELDLLSSEISMLDEQLRGKILENSNLSCDILLASTFAFADKIYEQALTLEKYASASKFDAKILASLHQRYDILRMLLWMESLNTKKKCPNLHTIVYFFEYESKDINVKAEQNFYSKLALDLKEKYPNKILLIPIASNLDIASVELAMENYNVHKNSAILIDEKKTISNINITLEEFEKLVFSNKNQGF